MIKIAETLALKLPNSFKAHAKSFLWNAYSRLDDSFQDNTLTLGVKPPQDVLLVPKKISASPEKIVTSKAGEQEPPAVVVNDLGTIANTDILRLALSSVFQTPVLSEAQLQIFYFLSNNRQFLLDHEQMVKGIQGFLLTRLSNGTDASNADASNADFAACLQALYAHEETTLRSRAAYSKEGKINPDAVFWPDPTYQKEPRSLFKELPFADAHPLINRQTPMGSAGSCFAMEIAHRLQAEGFNYLLTEPYINEAKGLSNSCARWGIIFNTPGFKQLVEKAFGERALPKILWSRQEASGTVYLDPFREDIVFHSVEEYEVDRPCHIAATREALLKAEVFVLTLGMNEVWRLKSDGSVFSRAPWRIAPNLVETKVMTVEENLQELQTMLDLWRRYNPNLKLILSVSPVPIHATFRADKYHVVTANCHSKSVLRVVAEEFAAGNKGVYYFPSYEVVMYCTENAWQPDQRHVGRSSVDKVMQLFNQMFVLPEAQADTVPPVQP